MITPEDIKKIAHLARIEMEVDETKSLTRDLERILEYMETLKEANIEGVPEAATANRANVFRADASAPFDGASELAEAAPRHEHGFIAVKKVIEN